MPGKEGGERPAARLVPAFLSRVEVSSPVGGHGTARGYGTGNRSKKRNWSRAEDTGSTSVLPK